MGETSCDTCDATFDGIGARCRACVIVAVKAAQAKGKFLVLDGEGPAEGEAK